MNKIKIEICLGTTCHVMGASELAKLEECLPVELANQVEIAGSPCLEACYNKNYGAAPFVRINNTRLISEASIKSVIAALCEELGEEVHDE